MLPCGRICNDTAQALGYSTAVLAPIFAERLGIMSLRWQHVGASHIVLQNTENAKGTSPYSSQQFLFDFHQCWI
jgi:hypothetical protein